MRVAIASYGQETSSFSSVPTTVETFRLYGLFEGHEVLEECRGVGAVGGFLEVMDEAAEWTALPLFHGWAGASGPVSAETFTWFVERLRAGLQQAMPCDALYFAMHGAAVAEQAHDSEGHLLQIAREILGSEIPIIVSLDHHANLTATMVDCADALVAHRTQPHDQEDTGRLSARLLLAIVRDGARPTTALRKIPLITHQEQFLTSGGPMKQWFDLAREIERRAGVLSASTLPMQPWLDVPEGGWAAAVVTDADRALADSLADELAACAWQLRDEFCRLNSVPAEAAVKRALAADGMSVITDGGDNIWGGGASDGTALLAEMLRHEMDGGLGLITIIDPAAVETATHAGVGATVTLSVGGKLDPNTGGPLEVTGRIAALGGGRMEASLLGFPYYDVGRAALVEIGAVRLVVTEERGVSGNHPSLYQHFGIDVSQARVVVVKTVSNYQFYKPWLSRVIHADTPGATTSHLEDLSWRHLPRPIYPLDPETVFPA